MASVTIRDLRNRGGEVVERVLAGERVTITRSGKAVAELRPLPADGLRAAVLLERWRHVPAIDERQFRRDIDDAMDPSV